MRPVPTDLRQRFLDEALRDVLGPLLRNLSESAEALAGAARRMARELEREGIDEDCNLFELDAWGPRVAPRTATALAGYMDQGDDFAYALDSVGPFGDHIPNFPRWGAGLVAAWPINLAGAEPHSVAFRSMSMRPDTFLAHAAALEDLAAAAANLAQRTQPQGPPGTREKRALVWLGERWRALGGSAEELAAWAVREDLVGGLANIGAGRILETLRGSQADVALRLRYYVYGESSRRGPSGSTQYERAVQFLRLLLADGPMAAGDVQERAARAGISPSTLRRARQDLGVRVARVGQGERWGGSASTWSLPATT